MAPTLVNPQLGGLEPESLKMTKSSALLSPYCLQSPQGLTSPLQATVRKPSGLEKSSKTSNKASPVVTNQSHTGADKPKQIKGIQKSSNHLLKSPLIRLENKLLSTSLSLSPSLLPKTKPSIPVPRKFGDGDNKSYSPLIGSTVTADKAYSNLHSQPRPTVTVSPLAGSTVSKVSRGLEWQRTPTLTSRTPLRGRLENNLLNVGLNSPTSMVSTISPQAQSVLIERKTCPKYSLGSPLLTPKTPVMNQREYLAKAKDSPLTQGKITQKGKSATTSRSSKSEPGSKRKTRESSRKIVPVDKHVSSMVEPIPEIPRPEYVLRLKTNEKPLDLPAFPSPTSNYIEDTSSFKMTLLDSVSAALISSPNFKNDQDSAHQLLKHVARKVAMYDPEFVLKTALYARRELNLRTPSNFLLALAANEKTCRAFVRKYFKESIRLPSDWIEVAELYQAFYDKSINYGSLPAALRRAMVLKFPDFDKYQLAKYNKDKSKSKKKGGTNEAKKKAGSFKKGKNTSVSKEESVSTDDEEEDTTKIFSDGEEHETEQELEMKTFTLKQLIRKLHITEPVEHVMCLIGKKYPGTLEEFYKCRLPGTWEEERAGKRMKLPVPITWETQVSLKGNKASTWEQLIDSKKLPFMAMLRNLRNMIKAGISPKHHNWLIRKLSDQGAVIYSKQFPFRFFSAYEVLNQLEADFQKNQDELVKQAVSESEQGTSQSEQRKAEMNKARKAAKGEDGKIKWWVIKNAKKKNSKVSEVAFDLQVISRYRKALDTAVKIATVYNVQPIKGRTVIFCDIGDGMDIPCTAARGLGKPRMLKEAGLLLGLMCKYSCEESELILYNDNAYLSAEVKKGTILDNMDLLKDTNMESDPSHGKVQSGFPVSKLTEVLRDRVQVDNMIILSKGLDENSDKGRALRDFLVKYRRIVSPDLLFVSVALAGKNNRVDSFSTSHSNDILMSGFSDQILRFIAEKGSGSQLTHVENIDSAYNLESVPVTAIDHMTARDQSMESSKLAQPINSLPVPIWRTVRVFISSTFRDMHGERDLLTRFVFPELRARAKQHYINVVEVDLRWGVTEEDTKKKQGVEICLTEVSNCDLFVGLLGDRHGWVPLTSDIPDDPKFDSFRTEADGASLTELEMKYMYEALHNPDSANKKAFFYIRKNNFIKDVPKRYLGDFEAEHSVAKKRMDDLKELVRKSYLCHTSSYSCSWGGVVDGKPFTGQLANFGHLALSHLWKAIMEIYPDTTLNEGVDESSSHGATMTALRSKFVGRQTLVKDCLKKMAEDKHGVVVLSGKPGCGKSVLMAAVCEEYKKSSHCPNPDNVLVHVVGSSSGSSSLTLTLRRLCSDLSNRLALQASVPQEFKNLVPKFSELLKASGNCSLGHVVVFIDGVDNMKEINQPYNMDWLPSPIPKNVQLVFTALEGGPCYKALMKQKVTEVKVGALDLMDKAKVIRSTLAQYRKSLDESPFNNQMKVLSSKRDASNPLYLTLACEELRVFGVFEKITAKLSSLPQTLPSLLGEILKRMETDLGQDLIQTSLCLLYYSRQGLTELELQTILAMHKLAKKKDSNSLMDIIETTVEPDDYLPSISFLQLKRALQSFLQPPDPMSETLSICHTGLRQAVQQRYLQQKSEEKQLYFHRLLAGLCWQSADPMGDESWQGKVESAFAELPYHLMCGCDFEELEFVLCDLIFIQSKCSHGQAVQLLEDFNSSFVVNRSVLKKQKPFLESERVKDYHSFVSKQLHLLAKYPNLTIQHVVNSDPGTFPPIDAEDIIYNRSSNQKTGIFRLKNKPLLTDQCTLTIGDLSAPVLCVAISPCGNYMACGDRDCNLKIYHTQTGKVIWESHGHSNMVTDVCYVDNSRLMSASKDGLVIVWDSQTGQRVLTLKGHGRSVNACASNGTLMASAGWDCNVKIWNVKNGAEVWEIKDMKPVNSVSFHPEDESVVTGCWDATIKIWDITHRKRKAVLRGHKSSVRAAAFSPSGVHIASAALDGEVKLWSAINGTPLADIQGHALPINKLQFSASGNELITVSDDQKIKVWSSHLGKLLHDLPSKQEESTGCVCFSPDGTTVAMGTSMGAVRFLDVDTGNHSKVIHPCQEAISCLTYTGFENQMIIGTDNARVLFVDLSVDGFLYEMEGHTGTVLSIVAGNTVIATTSDDFTCCLFRPVSSYELRTRKKKIHVQQPVAILRGHEGSVTGCSLNADETQLVTVSRDMSLRIWSLMGVDIGLEELEPSSIIHSFHPDWINGCQWSNTGDFLVTCSNDFTAKVWDVSSGKEKTTLRGHTSTINAICYKYGCIVTASSDGTAKVWSHKGMEITTLKGHQGRVMTCDLYIKVDKEKKLEEALENWADMVEEEEKAKKNKEKPAPVKLEQVVVVTCSDDGNVRVWKPLQANEMACLTGHSDRVLSLDSSPSGILSSCSLDYTVKMWKCDVTQGNVIGRHNGEVTFAVAFWDKQHIVSGSRDGCLKLWMYTSTEDESGCFTEIYTVQAHMKSVNAGCVISEDELAVGSDDGTISIWALTSGISSDVLKRIKVFQVPDGSPVSSVVLCHASAEIISLLSGDWAGRTIFWDLSLTNMEKRITVPTTQHSDWITSLQFVDDCNIYSASADGSLGCWECYRKFRGKWMEEIEEKKEVCLMDVCVHQGSCYTVTSDGCISKEKLPDSCSQQTIEKTNIYKLKIHSGAISAVVATTPFVFTASHDCTVKVWTHEMKQVGQFCCPSPVTSLKLMDVYNKPVKPQSGKKMGNVYVLLCGDKLGNVYVISWSLHS